MSYVTQPIITRVRFRVQIVKGPQLNFLMQVNTGGVPDVYMCTDQQPPGPSVSFPLQPPLLLHTFIRRWGRTQLRRNAIIVIGVWISGTLKQKEK